MLGGAVDPPSFPHFLACFINKAVSYLITLIKHPYLSLSNPSRVEVTAMIGFFLILSILPVK